MNKSAPIFLSEKPDLARRTRSLSSRKEADKNTHIKKLKTKALKMSTIGRAGSGIGETPSFNNVNKYNSYYSK